MTNTSSAIFKEYSDSLSGTEKSELRWWGVLGAGALAVAGVFALLVAFSRVPGTEKLVAWPAGFFEKGLVIHVVFSFVIWFLAVFALLVSLVTFKLSSEGGIKLAGFGCFGLAMLALSFPLLFLPAFTSSSEASLNNYVPVIIGKVYYIGLLVLALAILAPVIRLFANWNRSWKDLDALAAGMLTASVTYLVALLLIAIAAANLAGQEPSQNLNEDLFWGGGHVLQFLNTGLLLAGWSVLLRATLGREVLSEGIVITASALLALFALASPLLFVAYPAFSSEQILAFTDAKYVIGAPVLLVAIAALIGFFKLDKVKSLPWNDPSFLAVALAPPVFLAGGILGFFVDGADTRTPAHYHGMIAGVNLVMMGLFLGFIMPLINRPPKGKLSVQLQLWLFGVGQFIACIGLFWAGGYGAARKTAGDAQGLVEGAMIGMWLNGIGALIAVIGGIMFIWTVLRALLSSTQNQST